MTDKAKHAMDSAKQAVGNAAQRVKETVTGAASEAREAMGEAAAEQREKLEHAKESATVRADCRLPTADCCRSCCICWWCCRALAVVLACPSLPYD